MASSTIPCEVTIFPPNLHKLVAIHLKVHRDLVEQYLSFHHAVTTIVRGMAVNNPDILACPGTREDDLFIIVRDDQWRETGWRDYVKRINLEIIEDRRMVSLDLFASCLWHAIMYHLAPEWNRVGNLFIRGSDFLAGASGRKYNALDITVVCLPSGRVQLKLVAFTAIMSHITSRDLGDDSSVPPHVAGLLRARRGRGRMASATCFVLPKLSRGVVLSARKILSSSGVFENYIDVRNYWKSVYGYCLPHAEPEFYCEVGFGGQNDTVLAYPNYCLLRKKIDLVKPTQLERAQCITAFLTDLRVKMPTLCDVPIKASWLPWTVGHGEYGNTSIAGASRYP